MADDQRSATRLWLEQLVPGAIAVGQAADWLRAKLPTPMSPEEEAASMARFDAAMRQRRGPPAGPPAAQPTLASLPPLVPVPESVKAAGGRVAASAKDYLGRQFTPDPKVAAVGRVMKRGVSGRKPEKTGVPLIDAMFAPQRVAGNFAIDTLIDATTPGGALLNLDLPLGKAAGAVGGIAAALPAGFTSRIERLVKDLPAEGLHPSKLRTLLKSGANADQIEEIRWRGVDELIAQKLAAPKGEKFITPAELTAHLQANPAPIPDVTTLGEPKPPMSYEEWVRRWRQPGRSGVAPEIDDETLRRGYEGYVKQVSGPERPTKYGNQPSLQLPGGERYREHLFQLPLKAKEPANVELQQAFTQANEDLNVFRRANPEAELEGLRNPDYRRLVMARNRLGEQLTASENAHVAQMFRGGHFADDPNVALWTRTTDRMLPALGLRSFDEIEPLIQQAVGAKSPASIASGAPEVAVRKGLITSEEAALYGNAKGFTNYPHPPGERGRFLEEIQSDWAKAGKKHGYQTPGMTAADHAMAVDVATQEASSALDALYEAIGSPQGLGRRLAADPVQRAEHFLTLYPEHAAEVQPLLARYQAAIGAEARAQTALERSRSAPPDFPFKEAWPDVALKHHLSEAAADPNLSWLGLASGRTQSDRYNLAQVVSRLEYDPRAGRLYGYDPKDPTSRNFDEAVDLDKLDDYMGKGKADQLRQKIADAEASRAWEKSQWSVVPDEDRPGWFNIVDPNGEIRHDYGGRPESYRGMRATRERLDDLLADSEAQGGFDLPSLETPDLEVGDLGLARLYDEVLAKRFGKVLKPHGGTVERQPLSARTTAQIDAEMDALTANALSADAQGATTPASQATYQAALGRLQAERNVAIDDPAWIAKLPPEVKESINTKGFDILSLLPALGAGGAAAAAAGSAGEGEAGEAGSQVGTPPPLFGGGVPPIMLGKRRPLGSLAAGTKYLGGRGLGAFGLRQSVLDRFEDLYQRGRRVDVRPDWQGVTENERLQRAFSHDPHLAELWARFFGATSAGTDVPKNTKESIMALAHALHRQGEPFPLAPAGEPTRLYGNTLTLAGSKVPNLNLALQGLPFSKDSPKVTAMADFMLDKPRTPLDRHVLWGAGANEDAFAREAKALKALMLEAEGLKWNQLNEQGVYERYEDAVRRGVHSFDPTRNYNAVFGDTWVGARQAKDLGVEGGPADLLGSVGLLEPGALTDPKRLIEALQQNPGKNWFWKP